MKRFGIFALSLGLFSASISCSPRNQEFWIADISQDYVLSAVVVSNPITETNIQISNSQAFVIDTQTRFVILDTPIDETNYVTVEYQVDAPEYSSSCVLDFVGEMDLIDTNTLTNLLNFSDDWLSTGIYAHTYSTQLLELNDLIKSDGSIEVDGSNLTVYRFATEDEISNSYTNSTSTYYSAGKWSFYAGLGFEHGFETTAYVGSLYSGLESYSNLCTPEFFSNTIIALSNAYFDPSKTVTISYQY